MGSVFGGGRSRDAVRVMKRTAVWSRLRGLLRRTQVEAELHDELEFHILMQAKKHESAGLSPDEALARARIEFGNIELVKEDARDVRGARVADDTIADIKYAVRGLRRSPGFSLAVILTIGIGVGLNASVFTIFDAYVLRPFDVRDPHSLYSLQWLDRSGHVRDFAERDLDEFRVRSPIVSDVAAYRTFSSRLGTAPATGDAVTANYFRMTGVRPALGRTLLPGDDYVPVVVLSHTAWRNWFGADSSIVGRMLSVRGSKFRVVGVAQEGFDGFFKKPRDFWIPIGTTPQADSTHSAASADVPLSLLVRLAPGVSAAQGRTFFTSMLQNMTAGLPDTSRAVRVFLTSRATAIAPSLGAFLAFAPLAIVFGLILVLACANVANMLLARGLARQRELGTRLALGAGRARLVRQLLTEAVVLALPAVILGFGIASLGVEMGVRALFATLPADLTAFVRLVPIAPDLRVLGFALAASIGAAFVFGLLPALQTTRLSLADAIRGNFSASSPGRLRVVLVVGQITVASLLLTIAGILVREAARLGRTDTGLRTRDVVSVEVEDKSRSAVLNALRANRSVDVLAAAAALPLDMRFPTATVTGADSTRVTVLYNRVSSSYFDLLNIGIVGGRAFASSEEKAGAAAVVVSESAARRLWPGANPLGRVIHFELQKPGEDPVSRYQNASVVGVARDVVVQSLEEGRERPAFYFPQSLEVSACCILARVRGDPVAGKRALDEQLEKSVPGGVDRIDVLDTFVLGAMYPYRVAYWVALCLGMLALGLTVIGVYGVVGYIVNQRTREIGVRIALGARPIDVLRVIMTDSLRQATLGAAVGAILAMGGARILASNIQNMPPFDIVAFIGGFSTVVMACLLAALIPSWRAARVDATLALRQD